MIPKRNLRIRVKLFEILFKYWWIIVVSMIILSATMYFYTLNTYIPIYDIQNGELPMPPSTIESAISGAFIGVIIGIILVAIATVIKLLLRKTNKSNILDKSNQANKLIKDNSETPTKKNVSPNDFILYLILILGMTLLSISFWNYLYPIYQTSKWMIQSENTAKPTNTKSYMKNVQGDIIYPEFGKKYATLIISSAGIDNPVYFGDSKSELKKGVGHSSGSYLPGEGGTIVYSAHNDVIFKDLGKVALGDTVLVKTNYGIFEYKIIDIRVVNTSQTQYIEPKREKESLVMYTCYPFTALGLTSQRFLVVADRIEDSAQNSEDNAQNSEDNAQNSDGGIQ